MSKEDAQPAVRANGPKRPWLTLNVGQKEIMRATALVLFTTFAVIASAREFIPEERTAIIPKEKALDFVHRLCFEVPPGITGFWTPSVKDPEGVEAGLIA